MLCFSFHINREQADGCERKGRREWAEKGKGIKHKLPLISHGDIMYSIGDRVNNIILPVYGDRWFARFIVVSTL